MLEYWPPARRAYGSERKMEYGYAESSSSSLITTKRTKDTKGEWPIFLSCLRVLRGEITYDRIQLELFR